MGILETMIDIPAEHEKNVFGQFDIFAKKIERALHVTLIARNGKVKVLGEGTKDQITKRYDQQATPDRSLPSFPGEETRFRSRM